MKTARQQMEIDRARARLYGWSAEQPDAEAALEAVERDLAERAAGHLGQPFAAVRAGLAHEPFGLATEIFAQLLWLVGDRERNRKKTPLARYITERGWRETPLGKRWLRLLAASSFTHHDVVGVEPGESIRLARPDGRGKPFVVHEPRLADPMVAGLHLHARVLDMPQGKVLADGFVLLPPPVAAALPPDASPADLFAVWLGDGLVEAGHVRVTSPGAAPNGRAGAAGPRHGPRPGRPDGHGAGAGGGRGGAGGGPGGGPGGAGGTGGSNRPGDARRGSSPDPERDKLLDRVRKLFAMAQETEASPHEAEIALRRCQSLMARYGITEADLETSAFGTREVGTARTVPMHVKFLGGAVAELHDVIFVTGRGGQAEFRGYALDADVAAMTLDYLLDAVERALSDRRRRGTFPPGRSAAYDYRVNFAAEVRPARRRDRRRAAPGGGEGEPDGHRPDGQEARDRRSRVR